MLAERVGTDQHQEVARARVIQPRDLLVVALEQVANQVRVQLAMLLAVADVVDAHEQREQALARGPLRLLGRGHEVALEAVDLVADVARPRVDDRGVGHGRDAREVERGVGEVVGGGEVVDPVERAGLGLRAGGGRGSALRARGSSGPGGEGPEGRTFMGWSCGARPLAGSYPVAV